MGLKIITEEEAKLMAIECGNQVFLMCLEKFFPNTSQPQQSADKDGDFGETDHPFSV